MMRPWARGGWRVELVIVLVAIVALVLLGGANAYYVRIIELVLIYAMVGMALDVITGYGGQFSLGHSGLFAVGAYAASYGYLHMGIPFPLNALWAMAIAAVAGVIIAWPALRLSDLYLALATMAFAFIVQLAANDFDGITGGAGGVGGLAPAISRYGISAWLGEHYLWVVGLAFVVTWILLRRMTRSRWGRALIGMRDSEMLAASVGVDLRALKRGAFVLSAMVTGLAGALFAHLGFLSPDIFQLALSISFITIVFLGGSGTLIGSLVGAIVVVGVPERVTIDPNLNLVIYGALLIVVMIAAPRGVAGALQSVAERWRRTRSAPKPSVAVDVHEPATPGPRVRPSEPLDPRRALVATDVHKAFGGNTVLNGVDLTVGAGRLVGLIGPNGSGKTTLLNILGGQLIADAAELRIDDERVEQLGPPDRVRRGLARTFQHATLVPSLTVSENVMLGAHLRGAIPFVGAPFAVGRRLREERALGERAAALLEEVGVEPGYWHRRPEELPYGVTRIVEVAVALAAEPRYLMLDEPAAGLVEEEIERLAGVIDRCVGSGVGVLLVEHHLGLVLRLADSVVCLDGGKIIMSGDPETVARHPAVLEAYLGPAWATPATEVTP